MTHSFALWSMDVLDLEDIPRLASWDAKNSPAQRALQRPDAVERRVQDRARSSALHLIVHDDKPGARGGGRDLDNYLYPVVHRLGPSRFNLARATKTSDSVNRLILGQVRRDDSIVIGPHWHFASATTTVSSVRPEWKQQIHEQLAAATPSGPASPRPVMVELAFRVGPTRGHGRTCGSRPSRVLGRSSERGLAPFAPHDDNIVAFGLHGEVVDDLADGVELGVWWRDAAT